MLRSSAIFQAFNLRFDFLSSLEKTILDSTKVILFLKATNMKDRREFGLFLENKDGITIDWIMESMRAV